MSKWLYMCIVCVIGFIMLATSFEVKEKQATARIALANGYIQVRESDRAGYNHTLWKKEENEL